MVGTLQNGPLLGSRPKKIVPSWVWIPSLAILIILYYFSQIFERKPTINFGLTPENSHGTWIVICFTYYLLILLFGFCYILFLLILHCFSIVLLIYFWFEYVLVFVKIYFSSLKKFFVDLWKFCIEQKIFRISLESVYSAARLKPNFSDKTCIFITHFKWPKLAKK